MAIEITRFDTAVFDTACFDACGVESDFADTAQDDVEQILIAHGDFYTVIQTAVTIDGYGRPQTATETSFVAHMSIQDITNKDREIHEMGLATRGNVKAFSLPVYTEGNDTYEIKEGDMIVYNTNESRRWRVIKILGERKLSQDIIFKVMVLQNLDLEGTV